SAAKKSVEEIGERIAAEHLLHFFFRHRPEAATATRSAAAKMHVPAGPGTRGPGTWSRVLVHPPVCSELVVPLPLRRIAEYLVRLVDFLEPVLCSLVARVHIRVVLAGELPVRLLDFLVGRRLRHPERGVVVFEVHEPTWARSPCPAPL